MTLARLMTSVLDHRMMRLKEVLADKPVDQKVGSTWTSFAAGGIEGERVVIDECIRMRNEDIIDLFDQVEVGTPVIMLQ
jgi:hypothetical protein